MKWQRGQALVESAVVMPVLILMVLLAVQLIWLVFAQSTFRGAVSYALRAGALHHGDERIMARTLVVGMASLQPVTLASLTPEREELWQAQLQSSLQQWLHFQWAGKLTTLAPTEQVLAAQAETRYDLELAQWVHELAVDHPALRFNATTQQQRPQLAIEVWWCLPLEVPLAAQVLVALRSWLQSPAQRFCKLREEVVGRPLWALEQRLEGPLLSGYRHGLN
ncbi:TadE/TadG family type IV pilus assembly protein [Pseudidiomarina sediminum]|nr:TadE family protein [Pseudidiomarina sediminum]MBY6063489.1 pilus assembly protein [Pseudidiomarina sediminum]